MSLSFETIDLSQASVSTLNLCGIAPSTPHKAIALKFTHPEGAAGESSSSRKLKSLNVGGCHGFF